jgi:hypothetical protein
MAEKRGNKGLRQTSFVESLVPDPSQPRLTGSRCLTGFLGKGGQEGRWRLYLTPELDSYVEFSEEDVLHSETISERTLERTAVWIKLDATLQYTQSVSAQADFLQGDITSGFLQDAALVEGFDQQAGFIIRTIIRVSRRICPSVRRCPRTNEATICRPDLCPIIWS